MIQRHSIDYWIKNKSIDVSVKDIEGLVAIHRHEFYEIEIILDGAGVYNIDGIDYPIKSGSLFAMTPISFHHINFTGKTRLINFMFTLNSCNLDLLSQLFVNQPHFCLNVSQEDLSFLLTLAQEGEKIKDKTVTYYSTAILECVLGKICSLSNKSLISNKVSPVLHAILFMQNNFTKKITLEYVSKIANYSPNYFCTIFKEYTGTSFTNYLNNLRFEYATKLLINTDLSVSQISNRCGFNDYSHFLSLFKTKYGTTPKKYRQENYNL